MRHLLFVITLFTCSFGFSQATDLIISEYVEGSSNNKYIEVYNGTASSINLTNYQLQLFANGAAAATTTVTLSGSLASGATIVYKNSGATIYGGAATVNTAVAFNGDDAIALFKISTSSFVDIVGNIGCDPGTAWTSGAFTTLDKTIVRNASVCSGVTVDPTTVCTFPTLSTEWTQSNVDIVSNLGSHTMTCVACTPGAAPSTLATTFSATTFCTSATISFTAGNGAKRIAVVSTTNFANTPVNGTAYTANTTFGSGSTVGAGNFVVLNGTGNSVTITGLTANTTYFMKVFEYNGATANCDESYLTAGVTSFSFTTQNNCATPQIRSILADACSSQEGLDELVIIENGANPLAINDITLTFPSGGTFCNSGCGANTLQNNPAYITQLNTLAGCSLFQYADPIPAGAIIIVFTGLTPSYVFDYSTQCPSATAYYAVFCNNASISGRFANSGAGTRTLDAVFGVTNESVTYAPNSLLGDGSFVDFDAAGNPTYRQELNCIYPLSVEWGSFEATTVTEGIRLDWQTISEKDADYFTIQHADYSGDFQSIGTLDCIGNSTVATDYTFTDRTPVSGLNYYRLKQIDLNGEIDYSSIVAVNYEREDLAVYYLENQQQLVFSKALKAGSTVAVYQTNGSKVTSLTIGEKTSSVALPLAAGIWLIEVVDSAGHPSHIKLMVH